MIDKVENTNGIKRTEKLLRPNRRTENEVKYISKGARLSEKEEM